MKKLTLLCLVLLFFFACKEATENNTTTSTENTAEVSTENETSQGEVVESGSFQIEAEGCLDGNEIKANGKIILGNGKPPAGYEIHYLGSSDAKPIVVAKGLAFNADGSFTYNGKLPDGLPLNLHETGGNINIVWTDGSASIYYGDCIVQ